MPAISANDVTNGIMLEFDICLFQVVEFQHLTHSDDRVTRV